jgi:hypothetical protein
MLQLIGELQIGERGCLEHGEFLAAAFRYAPRLIELQARRKQV